MPKEYICDPGQEDSDKAIVTWGPNDMQLGVEVNGKTLWITLNSRWAVQKLIRTLQRARNTVHGADA